MNARSDAQCAGFPKSLFSILFRSLTIFALHEVASAGSTSSSVIAARLLAQEQPHTAATPPTSKLDSTTRELERRRQAHGTVQLEPDLAEHRPPSKAAHRSRRRRRSHATRGRRIVSDADAMPAPGNSFISLRSPVRKVALPSNAEDEESAATVRAHRLEDTVDALRSALRDVNKVQEAVRGETNNTSRPNRLSASPELQPVSDSVGIRVAHLESKTLDNLASRPTPTKRTRSWWLEVILGNMLGFSVAFVTTAVLIYVLYKVIRIWHHRVTLRRVQAKVRRANEIFLGLHNDRSLCLCCVEFIPSSSPSAVTFLCGHAFHMSCVNKWYKRHSRDGEDAGSCLFGCPVCAGQWNLGSSQQRSDGAAASGQGLDTSKPLTCSNDLLAPALTSAEPPAASADFARLFALHSLCERYPDIVSKDDSERLASQPRAELQSELHFARHGPRSKPDSIFKNFNLYNL